MECKHSSFIFDPESEENICSNCGFVEIPSYLRDMTEEEIGNGHDPTEPNGHPQPKIHMRPTGMIVPRATQVDFSCGGFLSTKIDTRNKDFVGKTVNSQHFNKMRFINNYILSSTEMGTFKNAIWNVSRMGDTLCLPIFVKERAAEIFRRVYYSRSNIHNSKSVVCGCIYFACKEARINRNLFDIAAAAEEEKDYTSDIFKAYQTVVDFLWLDVPKNFRIVEEIAYLGSRIGIPERTIRRACDMYSQVRKQSRIYFAGKAPRLTGAALLCMAHKEKEPIDMEKLCKVADVSKYILEKRIGIHKSQEFFQNLDEIEWIDTKWHEQLESLKPYLLADI